MKHISPEEKEESEPEQQQSQMQSQQQPNNQFFFCSRCPKKFVYEYAWKKHLVRRHHICGLPHTFECSFCRAGFEEEAQFVEHNRGIEEKLYSQTTTPVECRGGDPTKRSDKRRKIRKTSREPLVLRVKKSKLLPEASLERTTSFYAPPTDQLSLLLQDIPLPSPSEEEVDQQNLEILTSVEPTTAPSMPLAL